MKQTPESESGMLARTSNSNEINSFLLNRQQRSENVQFVFFFNYRSADCIKNSSVEFFHMKFYHDKRSSEKQEITTFPVADTVDLFTFDSLNVTKCISGHVQSNFDTSSITLLSIFAVYYSDIAFSV